MDETATITHVAASTDPKYDGVSIGTVSVRVTDLDEVPVKVSFEQGTYTVAEGSSVSVKVKLDADPERTVTIPLTTANQGGTSNSDYSGVPNSVTFNSSEREKTFSFSAANDSDNDDGESVKLGFGTLPTGVSVGTTNETTVSITDDDVPSVAVGFAQSTYTVAEGSTVNITVTLSADPERTVRIPLTVTNQGGASDDDHSLVPEAITFNPGQDSRVFHVPGRPGTPHDDDDESVKAWLRNAANQCERRDHERDDRFDHRRRSDRQRELRAVELHGCRRRERHGESEAEHRSGEDHRRAHNRHHNGRGEFQTTSRESPTR